MTRWFALVCGVVAVSPWIAFSGRLTVAESELRHTTLATLTLQRECGDVSAANYWLRQDVRAAKALNDSLVWYSNTLWAQNRTLRRQAGTYTSGGIE